MMEQEEVDDFMHCDKIFMTIKRIFFVCRLVLRIITDDSKAICRLSMKFGAPLKSTRFLLERAMELGLDVIGVSFHVGSGCTDPETFNQAISDARYVFDLAVSGLLLWAETKSTHFCHSVYTQSEKCFVHQAEVGYNMTLLDIGGGFPGSDNHKLKFEEVFFLFF